MPEYASLLLESIKNGLVVSGIWIYIIPLILLWLLTTAWFKGLWGEFKVRLTIDIFLDGEHYHPIHNLVIKTPDGSTQIDHVVVSPYGIFVIETKHMKGWIFGDSRSKTWTQTLYRRKSLFQNPLRQNYKHTKAIENTLELSTDYVFSIVVFTGSAEFRTPMPSNVMHLNSLIPYIQSRKEILFSKDKARAISRKLNLAGTLFGSESAHVSQLKKNAKAPLCPSCGTQMVQRTASRGKKAGEQFWGCANYPKCRITK
jgi:hypothetical protein